MHMQNNDIPKLKEQEALKLEGFITLEEAGQILNHMKNNKSPGFSAEFLRSFGNSYGHLL